MIEQLKYSEKRFEPVKVALEKQISDLKSQIDKYINSLDVINADVYCYLCISIKLYQKN